MSGFLGTGLSFPLSVDRLGGVQLVSGEQDVEQAIRIILGTAPGERPMRPEFGCALDDHLFDVIDAETLGRIEVAVRAALERWEPRIELLAIRFDVAGAGAGRVDVRLEYRLRSTNAVRNLVHPFYVIPAEEAA